MKTIQGLDLFYKSRSAGDRVIGTYLYPLRLFGVPDPNDPFKATEVVTKINVGSHEILVTRISGIFMRPPKWFGDPYREVDSIPSDSELQSKIRFETDAAQTFNRLLCELSLTGIVSEPVSPVHISYGQLINDHALITVGSGGRESYSERSLFPSLALLRGDWLMWPIHSESVLDDAAKQVRTTRLYEISALLPTLVTGAYSLYSRQMLSEALIDSWVVVEQLLDFLWKSYISEMTEKGRVARLKDYRTYTSAVQIEILFSVGVLDLAMYEMLNKARGHRNKLAHRATVDLFAATECMEAMSALIEFICGEYVTPASVSTGVNW